MDMIFIHKTDLNQIKYGAGASQPFLAVSQLNLIKINFIFLSNLIDLITFKWAVNKK